MIDIEPTGPAEPNPRLSSLFDAVAFPADAYCEAFQSPAGAREHWQPLLTALDTMGPEVLNQRQERARRMRHEDGATFNPFDDPSGKAVPWALEMIPLPITAGEWAGLETGLIQRALLLEGFAGTRAGDPLELLDDTLFTLSAFSGLAMESMTRGLGWRFMDIGRRVERAMNQTALLRVGLPLVCSGSRSSLEALLEVFDSIMTYRARYRTAFQLAPVLDLLLVDESNPKSLAFQFNQLAAHDHPQALDAYQFVFPSPLITVSSGARDYALTSFGQGTPVLAGALDLMGRIFTEFTYDKSATTVETTVDQVLASRKGVCQDFAHIGISCLRALGLAALYVSGYLKTSPLPGQPKLIGADASHAWISVFVPETGWVDLDPTNNLIAGEAHITIAWGRDYADVTPVKGVVMGGGVHNLSVMVEVKTPA